MLFFDLRKALDRYERRHGVRLTLRELSKISGLPIGTAQSLNSRRYNPTLRMLDRLCSALRCKPTDLLQYFPTWLPVVPAGKKRSRRAGGAGPEGRSTS